MGQRGTYIHYTEREWQRTLPAEKAIETARAILMDRHKIKRVCLDDMKPVRAGVLLSFPEFNDLVHSIYRETLYWERQISFVP